MTRGETQTGHAFCERRRCLAVMTRGPFRAAEISNEYESSILLRKLQGYSGFVDFLTPPLSLL